MKARRSSTMRAGYWHVSGGLCCLMGTHVGTGWSMSVCSVYLFHRCRCSGMLSRRPLSAYQGTCSRPSALLSASGHECDSLRCRKTTPCRPAYASRTRQKPVTPLRGHSLAELVVEVSPVGTLYDAVSFLTTPLPAPTPAMTKPLPVQLPTVSLHIIALFCLPV